MGLHNAIIIMVELFHFLSNQTFHSINILSIGEKGIPQMIYHYVIIGIGGLFFIIAITIAILFILMARKRKKTIPKIRSTKRKPVSPIILVSPTDYGPARISSAPRPGTAISINVEESDTHLPSVVSYDDYHNKLASLTNILSRISSADSTITDKVSRTLPNQPPFDDIVGDEAANALPDLTTRVLDDIAGDGTASSLPDQPPYDTAHDRASSTLPDQPPYDTADGRAASTLPDQPPCDTADDRTASTLPDQPPCDTADDRTASILPDQPPCDTADDKTVSLSDLLSDVVSFDDIVGDKASRKTPITLDDGAVDEAATAPDLVPPAWDKATSDQPPLTHDDDVGYKTPPSPTDQVSLYSYSSIDDIFSGGGDDIVGGGDISVDRTTGAPPDEILPVLTDVVIASSSTKMVKDTDSSSTEYKPQVAEDFDVSTTSSTTIYTYDEGKIKPAKEEIWLSDDTEDQISRKPPKKSKAESTKRAAKKKKKKSHAKGKSSAKDEGTLNAKTVKSKKKSHSKVASSEPRKTKVKSPHKVEPSKSDLSSSPEMWPRTSTALQSIGSPSASVSKSVPKIQLEIPQMASPINTPVSVSSPKMQSAASQEVGPPSAKSSPKIRSAASIKIPPKLKASPYGEGLTKIKSPFRLPGSKSDTVETIKPKSPFMHPGSISANKKAKSASNVSTFNI